MKKVSFKVAKAIKVAGYPQGLSDRLYACEDKFFPANGVRISEGDDIALSWRRYIKNAAAPTYIEVWLWLMREKGIRIVHGYKEIYILGIDYDDAIEESFDDSEDAIIAAIEYLVDNNLVK